MMIGFSLALVTMYATRWLGLSEFLIGAYTIVTYNAAITFPTK